MDKYNDDAKWLQDNLNELLQDSPDADKAREKKRLEELLSKFKGLTPNLDKISDKSAIFSKAYDYKEGLEKKAHWLDETQKLVKDEPFIDGLEDARAYLQEHEVGVAYIKFDLIGRCQIYLLRVCWSICASFLLMEY